MTRTLIEAMKQDARPLIDAADQFVTDTLSGGPVPVVGLAAVAAVLEHFVGLPDVLAVVVGCLWLLDMLGGMFRSIAKAGTFRAFSWPKLAGGVGKMVAVLIGMGLFGLLEVTQLHAGMERPIPMVAPLLVAASFGFSVSVLEQISDLWPWFGDKAREIFSRFGRAPDHDRRKGDP
jgi:hypothetical protein